MSTTGSWEMADDFANRSKDPVEASLILVIEVADFMSCGADISWLSMYPEEKEWLFPPLTYLSITEPSDHFRSHKNQHKWRNKCTKVHHVRPSFPG
jgi:hypothetical protein